MRSVTCAEPVVTVCYRMPGTHSFARLASFSDLSNQKNWLGSSKIRSARPDTAHAGNVGVQWGIFFALAAAGLLAYTGSRMRAAGHPGPPRARRGPWRPEPAPEEPRSPGRQTHGQELPALAAPTTPRPARAPPVPARERPPYPPAPSDQMSFDDSPPGSDRVR